MTSAERDEYIRAKWTKGTWYKEFGGECKKKHERDWDIIREHAFPESVEVGARV